MTRLTQEAEGAVERLGGLYGPTVSLGAQGISLLWCETGVVACDAAGRVRWIYETGLVDDVRIEGDSVVVFSGGGSQALGFDGRVQNVVGPGRGDAD